jgi:hypothetical protein
MMIMRIKREIPGSILGSGIFFESNSSGSFCLAEFGAAGPKLFRRVLIKTLVGMKGCRHLCFERALRRWCPGLMI